MAYIRKVPDSEATGTLRQIYDAAKQRAGSVAQIIQVMSLDGEAVSASMRFYLTLMKTPNSLKSETKELLATVVSHANDCFY